MWTTLSAWLGGAQVKTPPIGENARRELGAALRVLQRGGQHAAFQAHAVDRCSLPRGSRVRHGGKQWRLIYRADPDAILVVDLFRKTTQETAKQALGPCRQRLRHYEEDLH